MKWIFVLVLLPALAYASEDCSQLGGKCRDACGPNEVEEKGAFLDCTEKQMCCVPDEKPKNSFSPERSSSLICRDSRLIIGQPGVE